MNKTPTDEKGSKDMQETLNTSPATETIQAKPNILATPTAILVAGVLIAGAILFSAESPSAVSGGRVLEAEVLPVTADDHVYGSRSADIFFIEYSDFRCGYCGLFHETIKKILETYGGNVAWVYRHTPFQPGGYEAAHTSECIAELAGEDAFWQYVGLALSNQKELGTEWHLKTAKNLGADEVAFKACMESDRYKPLITKHMNNMQEIGGSGTPFSVVLTRNGDMVKISGAQPLQTVVLGVERALKSL
jgi:protein-disulfide isomerase